MMKILIVSGYAASGKTTLVEYCRDIFHTNIINVGDLLREKLESEGVSIKSRADIGMEFLSRYNIKNIKDLICSALSGNRINIVDGLRYVSIQHEIKIANPEAKTVYIKCEEKLREFRLKQRIAATEPLISNSDTEIFRLKKFDLDEDLWLSAADFVIDNSEGMDQFRDQTIKMLDAMRYI